MHMMLEPLLNFETVFVENRPIIGVGRLLTSPTVATSCSVSGIEGRAATYAVNVNLRRHRFHADTSSTTGGMAA